LGARGGAEGAGGRGGAESAEGLAGEHIDLGLFIYTWES
jgi:hypothetical protein